MSNQEKIFCGSGKEMWDGKLIKLNVCLSDIPKEFMREYQGKIFVNLDLFENQNPSKNTHHLVVNTWRPQPRQGQWEDKPAQQAPVPPVPPVQQEQPINPEDQLPF